MGAQLYVDIRNNLKTPFKKVGRGKFTLNEARNSAMSADVIIDNQNRSVRDQLLAKLLAMESSQFEVLVGELLSKLGYESVKVTGRSGDKGIDISAILTMGGITSVKTVVQVKRYKTDNKIGGDVIAQLRGSAEVDQRGLVITSSDFTKAGISEASAPNKMPVFALDADYFDNTTSDEEEDDGKGKRRGLWPLPGGINAYVETLYQILDVLHAAPMTKSELSRWIMKTFTQVKSEKTAASYVNVPRTIGTTTLKDGKFILTENGEHVQATRNSDFLYTVLENNVLGIGEIMELLRNDPKPQTEADVLAFLKENLGVEWTTFAQVNFRLLWLMNLGKVIRTENGYTLA